MVKPQLGHDQVVSEYRWSQEQVSLYKFTATPCSNQDTLTGPKVGRIRGSSLYTASLPIPW